MIAWLGRALDTTAARIGVWIGGLAVVGLFLVGQQATDERIEAESRLRAQAACASDIRAQAIIGAFTRIAVESGAEGRSRVEHERVATVQAQIMDRLVHRPSPACREFLEGDDFQRRVNEQMGELLSMLADGAPETTLIGGP